MEHTQGLTHTTVSRSCVAGNKASDGKIFVEALDCQSIRSGNNWILAFLSRADAIGSNGGFGYRSQLEDYDIALMDSALLAHWACVVAKPPVKQKIRY